MIPRSGVVRNPACLAEQRSPPPIGGLAAARTAGATMALELTNEADVSGSLEYQHAHHLLPLRVW